MGVLSRQEILKHIEQGTIVVDPYNEKNLANSSYDVRLGRYFFRQKSLENSQTLNPFDEDSVKKFYGQVQEATPVSKLRCELNQFKRLGDNELVILVAPGETILAHTIEFIGGRNAIKKDQMAVTTEMRARSSIGRIGIGVCKCAGWGDIGYVNRWTMEITNFSSVTVPLPVGLRIAQIIFHEVEPINIESQYENKGKYQTEFDMEKLKQIWKPEDMLPKLYNDKDLGTYGQYC